METATPSKRLTKAEYDQRYFDRYLEKHAAYLAIKNIRKPKGQHAHHWSYAREHMKDVIFMVICEHKQLHKFIVYDQERRAYRRYDTNVLLDTRRKHESFFKFIICSGLIISQNDTNDI